MQKSETKVRVRYGETDQMGVVYHANYAQYFEIGRTEWLRQIGITYKSMEDGGVLLPVISLSIQYKKSAVYDDELTVFTTLEKLPQATITFNYELYNKKNELLVTGSSVLAFINKERNRPVRCPEYLTKKLKNLLG